MGAAPTTIPVGLRFRRKDAQLLQFLADRVRGGEIPNHHASLFEKAAQAASSGEPLVVHCTQPLEAIQMADAFVLFGCERPAVEPLTSSRR